MIIWYSYLVITTWNPTLAVLDNINANIKNIKLITPWHNRLKFINLFGDNGNNVGILSYTIFIIFYLIMNFNTIILNIYKKVKQLKQEKEIKTIRILPNTSYNNNNI